MFDYLLPIGTVVRLKDGNKDMMIVGVLQEGNKNERYDYTAVTYPEGFIDPRLRIVFNQADIGEVVCFG